MKKNELIITTGVILCLLVFVSYFFVTSKIARAENATKVAQDATKAAQEETSAAKKQLSIMVEKEANARKSLADYIQKQKLKELAELERLGDDLGWVKAQDKLPFYLRFTKKFPDHPEIDNINKRIIDLEVKEISAGEYGEMPRAQALSIGGKTAEVEIENKTGYVLTIRYSGPDSKKVVIPAATTETISLMPGEYQVAASVSASHVTNYFGRDSMAGGKYSSSFYIITTSR